LRPTEGALAGSQVLPTLFACQRIGGQERTKVVYFAQFWCNHAQVVAPSGGESPLSLDEQPQNDEHDREGVGYGDRHRAHQPVLRSQRASSAFIYLPLYQFRSPTAIVHVRTAGEPLASDSGVMDSSTECGLARLRHFHARSAHDAHFVAGAGVLPRGGDDIHRITSGLPIIRQNRRTSCAAVNDEICVATCTRFPLPGAIQRK
jgi:hypothetical protein